MNECKIRYQYRAYFLLEIEQFLKVFLKYVLGFTIQSILFVFLRLVVVYKYVKNPRGHFTAVWICVCI